MAKEINTKEKTSVGNESTESSAKPVVLESPSSETVEPKPFVKKPESLESALRRFKKQSSGIISEVRKREAYDKPSVKRKKKSKAARKNKKMSRYSGNKW